ncbi:AI-2E family transporter [Alkalihalobacillus trypoxylicola]|uniref:Serine protease n=1 Tax=Alkalihalobacillus trypoxylicola TaxID=519424 RepID=A0A162E6P5_9BACI|nr:AI-2E family transporter [Alkalihalobacillus trypoxylicola]KYG31895.1 serine protease [Alkalihalobacillus trypoxylicola]
MEREKLMKVVLFLFIFLLILASLTLLMLLSPLMEPIFQVIKAISLPLLLAVLITYLFHPLVEGLHEYGLSRGLAVLFMFLFLITVSGFILFLGLPFIVEQIQGALKQIPQQMNDIENWLMGIEAQLNHLPAPLHEHADQWIKQLQVYGTKGLDQVEGVLINVLKKSLSFVVIPFIVFYLLKDYHMVQKAAWYMTPKKWRLSLQRYIKDVDHSIGNYIRGQLLVSFCVFVLATIGLWILGVPYAVLLGLFIGAVDIIPYFGPIIGAIPAVLFAFMNSFQTGIFTIIVLFVIQQIEGNILSPLIVGRTLHMHPIFIIFALLIGVEAGGLFGLLLAVPILAVIKVTLWHIRLHFLKKNQGNSMV